MKSQSSSSKTPQVVPPDSSLKDAYINQPKRIIAPLIKHEKHLLSDLVKYQNKKRETCTKLVFTQTRGLNFSEVVSQGLLQTLKTFKTVKEVTFVLSQVNNHDHKSLKALEKCFYARFSSLNRINFILAQGCNIVRNKAESSFKSLNVLIKILKRSRSLEGISLNLNICQPLNHSTSKSLLSALKKFAALQKIHLNLFPTCRGSHLPCTEEYTKRIANFLQNQSCLRDLELDFSSKNEIPDKLFEHFLTTLENLKSLKKFKLQLKRYLSRSITDPKLKKFCTHLKELESLQTLDLNFAESSISNIGITSFAASLKQLPLLHTINLDFSAGILITPEWIKSLINSLDKLQNLRCLGLDLECCDTALAQLSKGLINFTNLITFKLRLIGYQKFSLLSSQ